MSIVKHSVIWNMEFHSIVFEVPLPRSHQMIALISFAKRNSLASGHPWELEKVFVGRAVRLRELFP